MKKHREFWILGAVACAIIIATLTLPKRPPLPSLPRPNGYDDLLKAAQQAVSERHLPFGEATDAELKALVEKNQSAMDLARAGCAKPCRVATDYTQSAAVYAATHMPVMAQFKKLALAFRAAGELAEREHRTNEAARVYLDGIRLGQEMCRGGLLIDRMVGISVERTNLDPLEKLVPSLDAATCRDLAKALEEMDAKHESIQGTRNEERIWVLHVSGVRDRLGLQLTRLFRPRDLEAPWETSTAKLAEVQAKERALMRQLAARGQDRK